MEKQQIFGLTFGLFRFGGIKFFATLIAFHAFRDVVAEFVGRRAGLTAEFDHFLNIKQKLA